MDFKRFNSANATVNVRTKAKNSMEFKIENYIKNHGNGRVQSINVLMICLV